MLEVARALEDRLPAREALQAGAEVLARAVNAAWARVWLLSSDGETWEALPLIIPAPERGFADPVFADPRALLETIRSSVRPEAASPGEGPEILATGWRLMVHRQIAGILALGLPRPAASGTLLAAEAVSAQLSLYLERREEWAELDESPHYRALFEANPLPMWVYDLETLRFLTVNEAAIVHYGYSREEFLALSIFDIRPEAEHRRLRANVEARQDRVQRGIWVHRRRDGSLISVEVMSHNVTFAGRPARLVLANDVTERLRAESECARLAAIVDATTDLVAVTLPDGAVSYLNHAGRDLLEVGQDENLNLTDFRTPAAAEKYRDVVLPEVLRDGVWSGESEFRSRGGWTFPVLQVVIPHRDAEETVTSLSVIARDITAYRRLETQLRENLKMEAVGRLAGGIAHDFNNMLTVINGYSELLLHTLGERDALRKSVEEIQRAGLRAAALTHQLLAFSRRQLLHARVMNLTEVVRGLIPLLRSIFGGGLTVYFELEDDLAEIRADQSQLEHVLLNLCTNARDATPDGGSVRVRTANVWLEAPVAGEGGEIPAGEYVQLSVVDEGGGMTPEVRARAFEPFFTTKRQGAGTGLGLSTVYGIVKQSEGYLLLETVPGEGTTVSLFFRVVAGNDGPTPVSSPS